MHVAVTHDNAELPAQCCFVANADRCVMPTTIIGTWQCGHRNGRVFRTAAAWITTFNAHCNKISNRLALLCRKQKCCSAHHESVLSFSSSWRPERQGHFTFGWPTGLLESMELEVMSVDTKLEASSDE